MAKNTTNVYGMNVSGNDTTPDQFGHFLRDAFTGNVTGMAVAQNGTPNMTVTVAPGTALLNKGTVSSVVGEVKTSTSVTISTAPTSNSRIDAIIIYEDTDVSITPYIVDGAGGRFKLAAVLGTVAASPSAPSDSDIQTEIGAGKSWTRLANVTVGTNVTSIINSNISDQRTLLQPGYIAQDPFKAATTFDFVESGLVLTGTAYGSGLGWSLTAGYVWVAGVRYSVAAATGSVTASKDTYFDVLAPTSGTVATLVNTGGNIVTNNAASPALAANSIRIGIIQSGANIASIAAINQGQEDKVLPIASSVPYAVTDSLGNLICPRDPNRRLLGVKRLTSSVTTTSTTVVALTGYSVPVIVPTGRKVKITVSLANVTSNTVPRVLTMPLYDGAVGGTVIAQLQHTFPTSSFSDNLTLTCIYTPTAGSHTFNVGWFVAGGAATLATNSSSTSPDNMIVELV